MTCRDIKNCFKPEELSLPAFWSAKTEKDDRVLAWQMRNRRFDVSSVTAVAKRCAHGFPQVIVSYPFSKSGNPFPTLFWLTCPFLDRRCGELESQHMIAELEELFAQTPAPVKKMHEDYAALRLSVAKTAHISDEPKIKYTVSMLGVGGIDTHSAPNAVKCLHLQTATWLGMGKHPAEFWLKQKLGPLECASGKCAAAFQNDRFFIS
ncbi:MAG: DUF501 domain-containing protein [Synergistes sp.]|nr:DUF501 domain-containing protein [Synergistes sp.]